MTRSNIVLMLACAPLLALLCAGALCQEEPERICEPGRADDCPCVGGGEGVQVCADDGSAWGDCDCDGEGGVDAGPEEEPDAGPESCDGATRYGWVTPECDACVGCAESGPCATDEAACNADPECAAFFDCALPCEGDEACITACDASHPVGSSLYRTFYSCLYCVGCPVTCDWDLATCP